MGAGCDDLVVIDADNEDDGVDAEHRWVRDHFPGFNWSEQSLSDCEGKPVDIVEIHGPGGEVRKIYFDISMFFGKL